MNTIEGIATRIAPPRTMSEAEFAARYTDEGIKAEWVNGEVITFMPATVNHNLIEVWLIQMIGFFISRHLLGKVFSSELEIRAPGVRRVPDVCFVSDARMAIVKETHIEGAPDLVIEIVSADSVRRDWHDKYLDYERIGVREYWIVDVDERRLRAFQLGADGRYAALEEQDGKIHSQVLSGFWIRPSDTWQDPLPNTLSALKELNVLS